jgi:hypothetical protein
VNSKFSQRQSDTARAMLMAPTIAQYVMTAHDLAVSLFFVLVSQNEENPCKIHSQCGQRMKNAG